MTAIDFSGFVDRLAQASAEVILPFFRSAIGVLVSLLLLPPLVARMSSEEALLESEFGERCVDGARVSALTLCAATVPGRPKNPNVKVVMIMTSPSWPKRNCCIFAIPPSWPRGNCQASGIDDRPKMSLPY